MTGPARLRGGGEGADTLLLLHGLGASGAVWEPWRALLAQRWPGRWFAPDLPGHGAADHVARYSFGGLTAVVADEVAAQTRGGGGGRLVVLGHSLGGVVALALASGWYGVRVDRVVGLGIKVAWSDEELARAAALARRPTSSFDSADDAVERHLKIAGLSGLVDPTSPAALDGVRMERDGSEAARWRLALDQRAFAVGAPDLEGLLAAARADVVLARGEHDPMITDGQLEQLADPAGAGRSDRAGRADVGRGAVTLAGLGHNAHVEDPEAVLGLVIG